jgi:hypothetical protein
MTRPKRVLLLLAILIANAMLCGIAWAAATGRIHVEGSFLQIAATVIGVGPGWALAMKIWGWEKPPTGHLWLDVSLIVGLNTLVCSLIEILLFKFGSAIWRRAFSHTTSMQSPYE